MKWTDDEYRYLKLEIFELMRRHLGIKILKTLTIKQLTDAIDELLEKTKEIK